MLVLKSLVVQVVRVDRGLEFSNSGAEFKIMTLTYLPFLLVILDIVKIGLLVELAVRKRIADVFF